MKKYFKSISIKKGLLISIAATLLLLVSANAFLTNTYETKVYTTEVMTQSEDKVSVRVFKPKSATAENPAPAIVLSHGLSTVKEGYAKYAIELSKRGFVVLTPDMINHGGSDITPMETFFGDPKADAYGMYAAVRLASTYDFVDNNQIGFAGHSMGGNAANMSVMADNFQETPLISAVYILSSNPQFTDQEGNFINLYGDRDVGLFYSKFDHVYFSGTDLEGNPTHATEFLNSAQALSFVEFGMDPKESELQSITPGHTYVKDIDGKQVTRRIIQGDVIHTYAQSGKDAIASTVDFFQDVFVAPNYMYGSTQTGNYYQVLSALSFFTTLFVAYYVFRLLLETKLFKSLKAEKVNTLREAPTEKAGKLWFWGLTLGNLAFAFVSVTLIFKFGFGYFALPFMPSQVANIFALWSLFNGLFSLILSFASYFLYGKKNGVRLSDWGLVISFKNLMKSILLAILTFLTIIAMVFLAAKVFQMDMRFFIWGVRDMPLDKLYLFASYAPFFIIYSIAVSIGINGSYFAKIKNELPLVNDLFFAIMNMIPTVFITVLGYYLFMKTGVQPNIFGSDYTFTYMINAIPIFAVTVYFMRQLHKQVANPYISGLVGGLLITYFNVTTVFVVHTFMYMGMA